MIRSFDYAAVAALDRTVQTSTEDQPRLLKAVEDWREQCTQAYLAAYREAAADERLWPSDEESAQRLLDVFIVEKAIYEIGYELANRPNWLHVPLAGVARLLFPRESVE
jgi:maltose alpha-D-glucosyltransferase/alpha-amylase